VREAWKKVSKLFYQPHRPGDFTEPVYHELKHLPQRNAYLRVLHGSLVGTLARLFGSRERAYRVVMNERLVELPFVFRHLTLSPGAAVLEFGHVKSRLSLELASLGYRVTGVDLRRYPYSHPNLQSLEGDVRSAGLPQGSFDAVVAVSAIEHCGLSGYGEAGFERGDREIVAELCRLLRPGGVFLVTVPYGAAGVSARGWRVYDAAGLAELQRPVRVRETRYFRGVERRYWIPATAHELAQVDSVAAGHVQGVVCVCAVKEAAAPAT
jgi:SAM-dependent methyltransferase